MQFTRRTAHSRLRLSGLESCAVTSHALMSVRTDVAIALLPARLNVSMSMCIHASCTLLLNGARCTNITAGIVLHMLTLPGPASVGADYAHRRHPEHFTCVRNPPIAAIAILPMGVLPSGPHHLASLRPYRYRVHTKVRTISHVCQIRPTLGILRYVYRLARRRFTD